MTSPAVNQEGENLMTTTPRLATLAALVAASALATGCLTMPGKSSDSGSGSTATAAAPSAPKVPPGMNAAGEVVDPKKVESGHGKTVKGLNDYEGEITGIPVAGSKFNDIQIGMPLKQVMDIVGTPTDQGAYITGKAFIPFFFGSDRYRHEVVYKGLGRLIFAGSSGFDTNAHLIWIIHSANEQGYR
jgi:hypothetical protein